jgi:hypothetical protein
MYTLLFRSQPGVCRRRRLHSTSHRSESLRTILSGPHRKITQRHGVNVASRHQQRHDGGPECRGTWHLEGRPHHPPGRGCIVQAAAEHSASPASIQRTKSDTGQEQSRWKQTPWGVVNSEVHFLQEKWAQHRSLLGARSQQGS